MLRKRLPYGGYYAVCLCHSAWYYYGGLSEIYDTGKYGSESAHEITPIALDWIERNGDRDNWYLHINLWDHHTPYRTPADFENPFKMIHCQVG